MQRIGVVMGGTSGEREVSLRSGEAVVAALRGRGHDAVPLVLDDAREASSLIGGAGVDVAFLALHGRYGEDGCVQGVCELMGVPYTGSSLLASALAMDKVKSKELFRLHNVPTPPYYAVASDELAGDLEELHGSFGFPAVVKPRGEGSSLGVRRVDDLAGLGRALGEAFRYDRVALVERYVAGREVTVALLGGRVLGALEVEPRAGLFDFEAKYTPGMTAYHLPARLPPTRLRNVLNLAERAARALGCTSAVRVDVLVTEGENEYILEVNTQPGMTETSLLPRIAAAAGYDFATLCEAILAGAALHSASPEPRSSRRLAAHAEPRPARPREAAPARLRAAGA
ncbi:MAG TPA: D-alanine--D-alanine ligase [Polyangiaceae bacterium]|nr:D-alanine--D-alanine ligase [Polyangiaceae bacterium]